MDEVGIAETTRLIFSKSLVVKTLAKSKTKVRRETVFSYPHPQFVISRTNSNKYILLKSVLIRLQSLEKEDSALFVYLDVNSYVPPALLTHVLGIIRASAPISATPFIYTIKTVTVNTLNKKAPFSGLSEEALQQAQHQMDLLIFRRDFLSLLLESLPDDIITFNMEEAVMSVAAKHQVGVVDLTAACGCGEGG